MSPQVRTRYSPVAVVATPTYRAAADRGVVSVWGVKLMLTEFGNNIWLADGQDPVTVAGFHYPTRMAVIRLADGKLFVWSPVKFSEALAKSIEDLGPIGYLIAPNHLHHLYLADWINAFPGAEVCAAPGLRKKRPDLRIDAELNDIPMPGWSGQIEQVLVRGNLITTEVVFFHLESGTVLFTDLLQQFPADWFTGWRKLIARLDLMISPEPAVPRKFRMAFRDRKAARQSLVTVLGWSAEKVVMAHGAPVDYDGAAFLRRAFGWLV